MSRKLKLIVSVLVIALMLVGCKNTTEKLIDEPTKEYLENTEEEMSQTATNVENKEVLSKEYKGGLEENQFTVYLPEWELKDDFSLTKTQKKGTTRIIIADINNSYKGQDKFELFTSLKLSEKIQMSIAYIEIDTGYSVYQEQELVSSKTVEGRMLYKSSGFLKLDENDVFVKNYNCTGYIIAGELSPVYIWVVDESVEQDQSKEIDALLEGIISTIKFDEILE